MNQGQLRLALRLYSDRDRLKRAFTRILYHYARHIESFSMRVKYRHNRRLKRLTRPTQYLNRILASEDNFWRLLCHLVLTEQLLKPEHDAIPQASKKPCRFHRLQNFEWHFAHWLARATEHNPPDAISHSKGRL